jgi:polysaccharide export outer membrane protein
MNARLTFAMLLLAGTWPLHHSKSKSDTAAPANDTATLAQASEGNVPHFPGPSYVIGAEDTLHVSVWKEPELTATLPVRADGKISLPLLNDVQAAGLTPMQLAASLQEKLKRYLDDPRVAVVVSQMNSQRFFATGEVQHSGALPLLPNMTVLQGLASSGLTQFANTKKIYVLRSVNGVQQKLPVNYKHLIKGEEMSQNVVLKPGDTIVVP